MLGTMSRALFEQVSCPYEKTVLSLSVLLVLSGLVGSVRAEKADRNKPMNVESDALRYDDLKQVSIFTGNVILTKGSILIRGARSRFARTPRATSSAW